MLTYIMCEIQKTRDPTNNGVEIKIPAAKLPKQHTKLNIWPPTTSIFFGRCLHYPGMSPETHPCHPHAGICIWEAQGTSAHTGKNSFLEAKIVFYIRTIWESGKKYFLVLHDNNFSIFSCLFFFCEFHNSKSLLLKYLWETEKNGLFFWQPTPSGCYFQLPEGCGR